MTILKFIKGMLPNTEPLPIAVLEKAKTRCQASHGFFHVRYNLQKQITSVSGYVEENDERTAVIWNALGLAFVKGSRTRRFDLLITEAYETVC